MMRALLLAGSLGLALLLGEQLLRAVGYEYRPVSIDVEKTEDARYYHLFGSEHFTYDPDLIWMPKAGLDIFNEEGFRGPVMGEEKDPGRLRIVAIGDSNTLGWAGADGSNWPESLGRLLEKRGIAADVVNAGVWGYSSLQGVARLRQILAYDPDIVLVSFGSNDAVRVAVPDRRFVGKSEERRRFDRWFTSFRLGQLVTATSSRLLNGSGELQPRVSLEEYRRHLREMVALSRARGASIALLTRPFELQIPSDVWWKNFGYDYNAATAEVAVATGASLVDFYTHFKGHRELFADESHFTAEGHELAATYVLGEIAPLLLDAGGVRDLRRVRR